MKGIWGVKHAFDQNRPFVVEAASVEGAILKARRLFRQETPVLGRDGIVSVELITEVEA